MSIEFDCPRCGKAFNVDGKFAGKSALCKGCGGRLVIPSGEAPPGPDFDPYAVEPPPRVAGPASAPGEALADEPPAARRGWNGKGIGGLVFLVVVALRFYGVTQKHRGPAVPRPMNPPAFDAARIERAKGGLVAPPVLPKRGQAREIEPGVMVEEVRTGPPSPIALPAHAMTLWFYRPAGAHAPGSLPCVLIAPAGSNSLTGMGLAEGDRPEHLPYVRKGFAVLAYSLDGEIPGGGKATELDMVRGAGEFLAARAGLTNARVAVDWLAAKAPEVDMGRLYTAGHSSAGTMALLVAENEPRVKACAAFAPRSDVGANFPGDQKNLWRRAFPPIDEFFTTFNPTFHADQIRCPVFLFHAQDDGVVTVGETEAFADRLASMGKRFTLEIVPGGGHLDSMLTEGVPRAVAWFEGLKPRP